MINHVDVVKYLSIVNYTLNKVWKKLHTICRLLPLTLKVSSQDVLSIFDYCDVVWSPTY